MGAPTNVPAETAIAATMEATTAPSGMKMLFEIREVVKIFIFFFELGFHFYCSWYWYVIKAQHCYCFISDQTTMAAATTNIAVETGAAATMEATTAPSGVHNLHFIWKHLARSSTMAYSSRCQKQNFSCLSYYHKNFAKQLNTYYKFFKCKDRN